MRKVCKVLLNRSLQRWSLVKTCPDVGVPSCSTVQLSMQISLSHDWSSKSISHGCFKKVQDCSEVLK